MKFIFTLLITAAILYSCQSTNENRQKVNDLTVENQKLKAEKAQKEEQDRQKQISNILMNIDKYLKTTPNYHVQGYGGIVNGTVIIENSLSNVTFEKAIIETSVIKDNGEVFTRDYYTVENIEPGDVKTISLPNTTRGTSIKTKVVKIKSKELTQGRLELVRSEGVFDADTTTR
jgi:hypothetical protein